VIQWIIAVIAAPFAIMVALPAIADLCAWLVGSRRNRALPPPATQQQPLVFLVPAHDEALLIQRCVQSLVTQTYPRELIDVVVLADNCTDDTPALARAAGARVLERHDRENAGKGNAIGWALSRIGLEERAAVIVIDADTIVMPDFSSELMRWAPIEDMAFQIFERPSNESATWLTRLAGLFMRARYDIAIPLKVGAHLSIPVTGNGLILGRELLRKHPWEIVTITEGWEIYARLTVRGAPITYAPTARIFAQQSQSMSQAQTQRERWTSGRLAVVRLYWRAILTNPGIRLLQRIDLLAELTFLGPIVRGVLGVIGAAVSLLLPSPAKWIFLALFASGFVQPAWYGALILRNHPERAETIMALRRLPVYALWRSWVGVRAMFQRGTGRWVRTGRREER
jgi:cellulose synthase/poly-beta-1,6-N-acetylglucosamine synthase-like glycosyltransferase